MSNTDNPFVAPSDDAVLEAGRASRRIKVSIGDSYEFEATDLVDVIAAVHYIVQMTNLMAKRENVEKDVKSVGMHGPDCQCDQILSDMFGGNVPASIREMMDRVRKSHEKGN